MENYLKYFKWVALGGIFIVPFIVLVVTGSLFFPFITGKNFLFRILVEIIFGCWAVLAIYDKKYRPTKSFILYFAGAFIVGTALSTIFGANPYKSFWSNYERMEGLVTFFHLFAYFIALVGLLKTEKIWKAFLNVNLGVGFITACYGLIQLSGGAEIHQGGARLDASLGNASYLAIYAIFNIFIALLMFFKEKGSLVKWVYPPLSVLHVLVLYFTATRGAILGFVGGLFLAGIILVIFSEQKRVKQIGAGVFAVALLIVGGFWMARNSNFVTSSMVLSRFSTISVSETTTQSRLVIWGMAWEGFKEKPILGWGPENFNLVFNKYYEPILWRQEPWFDRAHNVFFDRLTTGGIVGLLSYLGLFAAVLYYAVLKRKDIGFSVYESATLTALLAAYFVHNIFVFDNLISSIMFFALLAYVHQKASLAQEAATTQEVSQKNNKAKSNEVAGDDYQKPALVVAVIVIMLSSLYFVNFKPYSANKTLLGALRENGIFGATGKVENLQNAFAGFKQAIAYNSFGTTEAREHLMNFASQTIANPKVEDKLKQEIYGYAATQMEEQIKKFPGDIRYMVFLGSLYNRAGQSDMAIDILQKAIEIAPNKQQLYFELASAYINKKEFDKSAEITKTAFELSPDYLEARKIYAVSLVYAGKYSEAEKILEEGFGTTLIVDDRLAGAYAANKKFDEVIEIYKKMIEADPTNLNKMLQLAGAYAESGQKELAIKELQLIISLEPKFKEQGDYYINQIKTGKI